MGPPRRLLRRARSYDYLPDIITTAKGITSSYAPMGAVIASDRVFEPFSAGTNSFAHGITFGGHPVSSAVALANLDVFENEGILENVREHEGEFRAMLDTLRDIPIVGDVRGTGYFHAIELVARPGDQGDLHRRGGGLAAARLPLARAVRARADLPRRRPRRPGDPVLAAADRRPGAVRRDARRPAAGARGGLASACTSAADARHAAPPRPHPRSRRPPRRRRGRARERRCAGCTSPSSTTRRRGCRAASCC